MKKILAVVLIFLLVGCQQVSQIKITVTITVVDTSNKPVQNIEVSLLDKSSDSEQGIQLGSTDSEGTITGKLKVGVTYEAALIINDETTQYEEFIISEEKDSENQFTFKLSK
ncbi:DUF2606 family protein [Cytobacillus kochii]|uniref:DUF2606 family protein n=2 Tax=Cytobacillus kochii TaxID=859143 RepID=UPI00203EBB5F|nr:Ig-like domain-containing protein [Cytobacillus kochii]MCM3324799.1 Ig-like domain-containing protein [Cytobacillus kochii]MCM3347192.1 Ig-like domain-containing protein [Cytobacillus kochii]